MLPLWTTKIITEPAVEPVTLEQVKNHSRITHVEDDSWLSMAMVVARQYVEKTCELSLITQTRRMTFRKFDEPYLRLSYGPTISITSVQYYDQANSLQTLASYQATLESNPCLVVPGVGQRWPSTNPDRLDAVRVTYVAGFGDPEQVPAALRQAILLLTDHWYNNRGVFEIGSNNSIPFGVDNLLSLFTSGNYR